MKPAVTLILALIVIVAAVQGFSPFENPFNKGSCFCKDGLERHENKTQLVLQADNVVVKTWDDASSRVTKRFLLTELDSLASQVNNATQQELASLSVRVRAVRDDYVTSSTLTTAIFNLAETTTDATTSLETQLSSNVEGLSQVVSTNEARFKNYATLDELRAIDTSTKTEATSGPCEMSNYQLVRYNTVTMQHEMCAKSLEDVYYWQPQGAPELCTAYDGESCQACLKGHIVDNDRCVMVADFFHLTFNNHLYDMSDNDRHVAIDGVPNDYSLAEGRDGSPAIELDGVDDKIMFTEPLDFGGNVTVCADVLFKKKGRYSRLIDYANGPGTDDFLIAMKEDSYDLAVSVGARDASSEGVVADFWGAAVGGWGEACVTVDGEGNMQAYMNGELKGGAKVIPIPFLQRKSCFIGHSNWKEDAKSDALFDNMRMWTRTLPASVIQNSFAQGRPERDWKGVVAALHLDGNLKDDSSAKWPATLNNALPLNVWRTGGAEGTGYAWFDGSDDIVQLQRRWLGGAFTACMHVKYDQFTLWTRLFHFFTTADVDEIQLFNWGDTSEIHFEIKNEANRNPANVIKVLNGFAPALGAFQHICVGVDGNGKGTVYRQGLLLASNDNMEAPKGAVRETNYLARARDGSANLDGSLDDFRFYSRALSQEEVQDVLCQGRPALDCVGMLGHYKFEGNARDSSANAWHGKVVVSSQEARDSFFTSDAKVGAMAVRFEGAGGYILLPARQLGGAFSIAVWVKLGEGTRFE
eukprot:TRINITY_DN12655_c0_g1_i6.p1 TRINITY_DN12655_c0_g1~~TRINITY_DN12655_c0_g1_i6.p1  ORF type:complete len:754 (+),score=192.32 TRINITY_DN12655_c0_g1_i6:424-2685(+)